MGIERCYYEYYNNHKKFIELYELIYQKQKEKYYLAVNSPANIIWCSENITSILTTPKLFKELCIPFYNEITDLLHKKKKFLAVHMDGSLQPLVELISKTEIDVIEAFTPPPMGDLSISEARKAWPDKVIWINFPGSVLSSPDSKYIQDYTVNLLREASPGNNFLLGCTESYLFDNWGMAFSVIENVLNMYGSYPVCIN
jgi:hypothetical protein